MWDSGREIAPTQGVPPSERPGTERHRWPLRCRIRCRSLLASALQFPLGETFFENSRHLFGLHSKPFADLLGSQTHLVLFQKRDNLVECFGDLLG
jgi:hypothetical protein